MIHTGHLVTIKRVIVKAHVTIFRVVYFGSEIQFNLKMEKKLLYFPLLNNWFSRYGDKMESRFGVFIGELLVYIFYTKEESQEYIKQKEQEIGELSGLNIRMCFVEIKNARLSYQSDWESIG